MVFQSYALYPNLSVRRNIGFGLRNARKVPAAEREKAVLEAARLLQIEPLLDRRPNPLSGGQRQPSPSAGRWYAIPSCFCSTSRSATSTPSSAWKCAPS